MKFPFWYTRHTYREFHRLNEVSIEKVVEQITDKGPRLISDLPESFRYADVTETIDRRILGKTVHRTTRRVRIFRSVFCLYWSYLESGLPTPGTGVETMELAYVARANSLRSLPQLDPSRD